MSEESIEELVLSRIKPLREEYLKIMRVREKIKKILEEHLRNEGLIFKIEVVGSIAKDTWISGEYDLDLFVLFPEEYGEAWVKSEAFKKIKKILSEAGFRVEEAYAEHPYVRLSIEDVQVDVVPALMLDNPQKAKTVVDRTPFHTRYISSKITQTQRDHVRLLKKFMKNIGVYGAEIKVEGFSGYLCELLILYYSSFNATLNGASKWKPFETVIDLEGYYDDPLKAIKKFNAPLIVVDPVDRNRNVAAAVSLKSMSTFIAASKYYLRSPRTRYFFPPKRRVSKEKILGLLKEKNRNIIALRTLCPQVPPDTLWGELKHSLKGLYSLLKRFEFKVLDMKVVTDEKENVIFLFELETLTLPPLKKHLGPPVYLEPHSTIFLEKHMADSESVGPWIDGDRWVVLRPRKYVDAKRLLKKNYMNASISKHVLEQLAKFLEVKEGEEVIELFETLGSLEELAEFLEKKPAWLYL